MSGLRCDAVRDAAGEFVLGTLDGAERADVLEHIADCARCREEIAALADTVNDLAVLAPAMEPSAGFTARVLARGADGARPTAAAPDGEVVVSLAMRRPRRRWAVIVAAAAAIAALTFGVFAVVDDGAAGSVAFAAMVAPDGTVMGSVTALGDGAVAVAVDYPTNWRDYRLEAVHLDGTTTTLGLLTWQDGAWRWQGPVPDGGSVDRVRVVRPDGQVTCWGRVQA